MIGVASILPVPTLRYGSTLTPTTINLVVVIPAIVPAFVIGAATSTLLHADVTSDLVGSTVSSTVELAEAASTVMLEN